MTCQVAETRHKGVKCKGARSNRNLAKACLSVLNAELRDSAAQRMAQALDEHGENTCICMYLSVCASILQVFACVCLHLILSIILAPGPRWHKRRRTDPGPSHDDSASSSDSEDILMATRYWDRKEAKKTEGCMADGLHCCIWGHAQSPGTVSLHLVKGWSHLRREAHHGNLGLAMENLAWTAGSRLPEPLLSRLPLLHFLAPKLVHFVVDYHPDWIASLRLPELPPSDGTHSQLRREDFHRALQRLRNMPDSDTDTPLQLFSAVQIHQKEWSGGPRRAVPSDLAMHGSIWHVHVHVCSCIRTYVFVLVCILSVSVSMRKNEFVF